MAVIKSSALPQEAHSVASIAFNLNDVSSTAQNELNQVKIKAAEIVKQAHVEAKKIRQQAEVQGRNDALGKARQSVKQEIDQQAATLLPALQSLVQELTTAKQEWLKQWETTALEVAVAIAEKVIRRELSQTPEIAADLVRETLQMAAGNGEINIRLNPEDLDSMENGQAMLVDELKKLARSQIAADPNLQRGDCVVETAFGAIDNRIATQLQRIRDELGGSQ